jgi:hypothetical protein
VVAVAQAAILIHPPIPPIPLRVVAAVASEAGEVEGTGVDMIRTCLLRLEGAAATDMATVTADGAGVAVAVAVAVEADTTIPPVPVVPLTLLLLLPPGVEAGVGAGVGEAVLPRGTRRRFRPMLPSASNARERNSATTLSRDTWKRSARDAPPWTRPSITRRHRIGTSCEP